LSGTVSRPHRWRRLLAGIAGVLLGLPVLLVLLILLAANVDPGRQLIERVVARLTSGQVVLNGLSGRFPDALRLAGLQLRDAGGPWITAHGLALEWSPVSLLSGTVRIARLHADDLTIARLPLLPAGAPTPAKPGSAGFSLPVAVDLQRLDILRLTLGAALAGAPATLKLAGSAHLVSLEDAAASISVDRLDSAGTYKVNAAIGRDSISARLQAAEPANGLLSRLAALPALGAVGLDATLDGPRKAGRLKLALSAGPLKVDAGGTVDLEGQAADLDLTATAPAMAPRPDLAWGSIALKLRAHGPFTRPDISADAVLTDVKAGGAAIGSVALQVAGNQGSVDASGTLTSLRLPPPKPDLFAAAPLLLSVHADLDQPSLPIRFSIRHPLLTADGTATARGDITATIHAMVPDLAPLAAIGNLDIRGRTEAVASMALHGDDTDFKVDGSAAFTGGQAPLPTLLGQTRFGVTARLNGQDLEISRATVDGRAAHAAVTGTDRNGALALAWTLALSDLSAASPQLAGALDATGHIDGPRTGLAVQADIKGSIGTRTLPRGPVSVALRADGLPGQPKGTLEVQGRLAGAPLSLSAAVQGQGDGGFHAVLHRAAWKSLTAVADLMLAKGQMLPTGTLTARMSRLADLGPLIGQSLSGSLDARLATIQADGRPEARIDLHGADIAAGGATLARLSLTGRVRDPVTRPDLALALAANGLAAGSVSGDVRLTANGPQTALALSARSTGSIGAAPAGAAAGAVLDLAARTVSLRSLAADYKGLSLRLQAPARFEFGAATGIDHLGLSLAAASGPPATIEIAGRIAPALALTAALRNVTPALAQPFVPSLQATGLLTADANLTGTAAAPHGSVRMQATGLRLRSGPAAALPAASLLATLGLDGRAARIDARLAAGPRLHLSSTGTLPLQPAGPIGLQMSGGLDLALLNPVLGATGKRAAGLVALDTTIGGTLSAPTIEGGLTLAGAEIQDFVQGVRISAITARVLAAGDSLRIAGFTAKAGSGTLGASGTVGMLAPGLPVDLHLTADHATPLASDLLTATLDADLAVHGQAAGALQASGRIFVRRADINIPNGLPPGVAVLHVRRPGDRPPPPAGANPAANVALAVTVDAPSNIFVRGHGLDAELGGKLTVAGTGAAPQIGGGFQMRTGTFSVAGTTLTFSKGEIGFDGTGVAGRIDPTLDFTADSTSGSVTATLAVGGYADAPKITLSSTPSLPQDEVLAHLLFGESVKDLSALQIAEIATALADLSGVTGAAGDPLGAVRKGLGLDRLSVGSGSGSGATVEAGRYVARGVYVGAKQATSGGGTAAEVQVDITRRLKAKAQLATGGATVQGSTPDNDQGSTIGLSYQFDY
jgi:translocation and assembly module TamB